MNNPISTIGKKFSSYFSAQNRKLRQFQKQHHFDKNLLNSLNNVKRPSLKQLKYLPKVLTSGEKRRLATTFIIIVACFLFLVGNWYLNATVSIPKIGGEYSEGLVGSPNTINPIMAPTNDVDMDLTSLIYSGLVKKDKNRQLANDLAESYEISPDQLVYTFHLRHNIKWQDGEIFNADDVVFTFNSIQDEQFKSPLARSFRGVAVEKVDDYTVKFTLKEPFAPFLGLLTVGILPEHLWYNIPPATADLAEINKRPIGTGPWMFDNFKKDKTGVIKSYSLVPNPYYYGQRPYIQNLIFKFYGDFPTAIDALKNKVVDGISYLPLDFVNDLKKYKNLNYEQLDQPQYTALFLNQNKNTLLQADYIRQAMAMAIDKTKLVKEVLNDQGQVIDAPALPGITENPDITKYTYDPQKAAQLLENNSWSLVSTTTSDGLTEQVRQKKKTYLEVTLTTVNQPENVKIAEEIKKSWDQIGFNTTINLVDKSKIFQDVINQRNYEVLLFGENLGLDPDPFPFWHSSQSEYPGLNLAIFTDKQSDKLLEDARKTNDLAVRQKDYTDFQAIVAKELPAIFLYNETYTYPQDKSLKGFDVSAIAIPSDRFANINDWYVKTKRIWKK